MSWWRLLLSRRGRLNRARYWLAQFIASSILMVLGLLSFDPPPDTLSTPQFVIVCIMCGISFLAVWSAIASTCQRFHDRDKSGLWILMYLVPFGGIWIFIECGFRRGTLGSNRYGADPLLYD